MSALAYAIATCGFIAGSVNTTGLPEIVFTLFAVLSAISIKN